MRSRARAREKAWWRRGLQGMVVAALVAELAVGAVGQGRVAVAGKRSVQELVKDLLRVERVETVSTGEFVLPAEHFLSPAREREEPPGTTASLYAIGKYWQQKYMQDSERLPMALRERIVAAAEAYPEWAAGLAHLFPHTEEANGRLLAIREGLPEGGEGNPRAEIARSLSRSSKLFRPLLIENAQMAHEGEGYVENEEDLRALARLEWATAAPLLERLAAQSEPRLRTLALGLEYEHAAQSGMGEAGELRERLQAITGDISQPAKARALAVESLMRSDWAGREAWFLGLFADATLGSPSDGFHLLGPLETPVHADPERWIPLIAPLVESPNPIIRQNAIFVLVSFQQEEARADAERPLLPWLYDPQWVETKNSGQERRNLIYSLFLVPVAESATGLLHALESAESDEPFEAEYAAMAIARLGDGRAAPVLWRVLKEPLDLDQRMEVARALLMTGRVTMEEKVRAVSRAMALTATRKGLKQLTEMEDEKKRAEAEEILGLAVVQNEGADRALRLALRAHSAAIRASEAGVAGGLDALLEWLPDEERDGLLVAAIGQGSVGAGEIQRALKRRSWLRKGQGEALRGLAQGRGPAAAIAAVLLGDEERERSILSGSDREAQAVLLAVMRIGGEMVPEKLVDRLEEARDPVLAEAARRYAEELGRWRHML